MGGGIQVKSFPKQGTTCTFHFPLVTEPNEDSISCLNQKNDAVMVLQKFLQLL